MIHFLDTSALAKRYVQEPGAARVRGIFRKRTTIAVARISYAELAAVVARKERVGGMTRDQADAIIERLPEDFGEMTVIEVRKAIVETVPDLVRRHPLRGYDAVQLACALSVAGEAAVTFWCTDDALITAAAAEGLRTSKPN